MIWSHRTGIRSAARGTRSPCQAPSDAYFVKYALMSMLPLFYRICKALVPLILRSRAGICLSAATIFTSWCTTID